MKGTCYGTASSSAVCLGFIPHINFSLAQNSKNKNGFSWMVVAIFQLVSVYKEHSV